MQQFASSFNVEMQIHDIYQSTVGVQQNSPSEKTAGQAVCFPCQRNIIIIMNE